MKRAPVLESTILRAICDYLSLRRHFFYRSNNVPIFMKDRGAFRAMPHHSLRGVPDIVLIENKTGKFIGIEVKAEKGKLSEHQIAFQKMLEERGGKYIIARSIDDVQSHGL